MQAHLLYIPKLKSFLIETIRPPPILCLIFYYRSECSFLHKINHQFWKTSLLSMCFILRKLYSNKRSLLTTELPHPWKILPWWYCNLSWTLCAPISPSRQKHNCEPSHNITIQWCVSNWFVVEGCSRKSWFDLMEYCWLLCGPLLKKCEDKEFDSCGILAGITRDLKQIGYHQILTLRVRKYGYKLDSFLSL